MSRERAGLRRPTGDVAQRVPSTSRSDVGLHRVVARHHPQPWHFATRDETGQRGGRFDLPTPAGTCYLATTAGSALLERLADPDTDGPPYASLETLRNLTVWSGHVASADDLADTTVPSVPGLTLELSTIVPYEASWAWADAFIAAGKGGIVYRSRFGMAEAVALFDPLGGTPKDPSDPRHRGALTATPATDLIDQLPPPFRSHLGRPVLADHFEPAIDP